MIELTLPEIIQKIDNEIEAGQYDASRLDNIRESLRRNKPLFNSDQLYLEKILGSTFVIKEKEEISPDPLLPKVKKLIDSGSGDYGRLQSIYDLLLNGKSLYQSDLNYLQKKLEEIEDNSDVSHDDEKATSAETVNDNQPSKDIHSTKGSLPKGWDANKSSSPESADDNQNNHTEINTKEHVLSGPESQELSKIKQTSQEQKKQIESVNGELKLADSKRTREHYL